MDISKDSVKTITDDKAKMDALAKEKETKAPAGGSTAAAITNVIAPGATVKNEKPPVAPEKSNDREEIKPRADSVSQQQPKEFDIAKGLEKLEEKITRNIEKFKKVDAKIRETDDEIDAIKEKKHKEPVGDKIKKFALFVPNICVEANVCRFPKAICKGCGKMVDVWKSSSKAGLKALGEFTGKCVDSLSTGMRLPMIRMKMNKDFKELGDRAYQMYLEGDKEILKNDEVKKIIGELKEYEKQIEKLETHLTDLNEQSIPQKQHA